MIYEHHFSLSQRPFSIAPNPDFLYAQGQYREALATLEFAMVHRGGFVLLTGEVGTGKTTLCKHLLSHIPDDTEVALILHPQLDRMQMLQAICREFDLHSQGHETEAQLIQVLTDFLLNAYSKGHYCLLVVDEAQHLDPEVLELIRLLTNLETHKDKLLQIILLGQPELQQRLNRYDLRQLNQRFTARYNLRPLNFRQTRQYVQHRLRVADGHEGLFSWFALWQLNRLSQGIPRLINLIADRALMGAYGLDKNKVTAAVVKKAAKEVLPQGRSKGPLTPLTVLSSLLLLVSIVMGVTWYNGGGLEAPFNLEKEAYCSADTCWQGRLPMSLVARLPSSQVWQNGQWQAWSGAVSNSNQLLLIRTRTLLPFEINGSIKVGQQHAAVPWVRNILTDYYGVSARPLESDWQVIRPQSSAPLSLEAVSQEFEFYYDEQLQGMVERFQLQFGLTLDGYIGAQTLMALKLLPEDVAKHVQGGL